MINRCAGLVLSGIGMLFIGVAIASNAPRRLHVEWPPDWEYLPAIERESVVYFQARQTRDGKTLQRLSLSAVDTRLARKAVTPASAEGLMLQLRDAAQRRAGEGHIPIRTLPSRDGYYFVASTADRSGDLASLKQYAEGAILHSGYLVNFTLHTDDAASRETEEILRALDQLTIE